MTRPDGGLVEETLRGLVGGAAYGLTVVAVSHPFDTVKTRQQVLPGYAQLGVGPAFARTVREGGWRALYKGFTSSMTGSVLFRSVPFVLYSGTTSYLSRRHEGLRSSPVILAALGGAAGGLGRAVLETPFELAKTRRMTDQGWSLSPSALSTGLAITALRNTAVISLFWVLVELSK